MRWSRAEAGVAEASKGNLTDPESGLMIDGANKAFVQGYNAQVVAAGVPQMIVAQTVVSDPTDRQQLKPMMQLIEQTLGAPPELTMADAGYWNESSITDDERLSFVPLTAAAGVRSRKSLCPRQLRTARSNK
jgi:hypothetical protein